MIRAASCPHLARRIALMVGIAVWCALDAGAVSAQHTGPPPAPLTLDRPGAPSIQRVQRAALVHAGLLRSPTEGWARRARRSNLVPQVEVRSIWWRQDNDQLDYREDERFDALGHGSLNTARHDVRYVQSQRDTYSVSLRFDPAGLVFDRRELDIARHEQTLATQRQRLIAHITQLYFERLEHLAALHTVEPDDREAQLTTQIQIWRCEAELDAMTGGWYSQKLQEIP